MGTISNFLLAAAANRFNRHRSRISNRLLEYVSTRKNLIVCGGRNDAEPSKAYDVKCQILARIIADAMEQSKPGIFVYSDPALTEELREAYENHAQAVFFGVNTTYQVFDRNLSFQDAYDLLSDAVEAYSGWLKVESRPLLTMLQFLMTILYDHLEQDCFTFHNLCVLVDHLIQRPDAAAADTTYTGEKEFLDWVQRATGKRPSNFIQNELSVEWEELLKLFYPFWLALDRQLGALRAPNGNGASRSLLSCMLRGKTCICFLPPNRSQLLQACLFGELALLAEENVSFDFNSFQVNLDGCKRNSVLDYDQCHCCLIGDSLRAMGLSDLSISDPQIVCLGLSMASDARELLESVVATKRQTDVQFSPGRTGSVSFGKVQQKPLVEDDFMLRNILDGQAYLLDSAGYRFVHNILV